MSSESSCDGQDNGEGKTSIVEPSTIFRKNADYLYDVMVSDELPWSARTCDWLPDRTSLCNGDYQVHQLVYGTQEDANNSLVIARIHMPNFERAKVDNFEKIIDEDRRLETGYGILKAKHEVFIRINHAGLVNRARHMPQNSFLIATFSSNGKLYVFDYSKHPSVPESDDHFKPNLILGGHVDAGYGLAWSKHLEGRLLSGSNDCTIGFYDTNQAKADEDGEIAPIQKFQASTGRVLDVAWNALHENIFVSANAQHLSVWDTRVESGKPLVSSTPTGDAFTCLALNQFNANLMATGSSQGSVALFDIRNLGARLHAYTEHTGSVDRIAWSPHFENVLASASSDNTIRLWDVVQIRGKDNQPSMFVHAGHRVSPIDLSFNLSEPWLMASIADKSYQVWKMSAEAYGHLSKAQFTDI